MICLTKLKLTLSNSFVDMPLPPKIPPYLQSLSPLSHSLPSPPSLPRVSVSYLKFVDLPPFKPSFLRPPYLTTLQTLSPRVSWDFFLLLSTNKHVYIKHPNFYPCLSSLFLIFPDSPVSHPPIIPCHYTAPLMMSTSITCAARAVLVDVIIREFLPLSRSALLSAKRLYNPITMSSGTMLTGFGEYLLRINTCTRSLSLCMASLEIARGSLRWSQTSDEETGDIDIEKEGIHGSTVQEKEEKDEIKEKEIIETKRSSMTGLTNKVNGPVRGVLTLLLPYIIVAPRSASEDDEGDDVVVTGITALASAPSSLDESSSSAVPPTSTRAFCHYLKTISMLSGIILPSSIYNLSDHIDVDIEAVALLLRCTLTAQALSKVNIADIITLPGIESARKHSATPPDSSRPQPLSHQTDGKRQQWDYVFVEALLGVLSTLIVSAEAPSKVIPSSNTDSPPASTSLSSSSSSSSPSPTSSSKSKSWLRALRCDITLQSFTSRLPLPQRTLIDIALGRPTSSSSSSSSSSSLLSTLISDKLALLPPEVRPHVSPSSLAYSIYNQSPSLEDQVRVPSALLPGFASPSNSSSLSTSSLLTCTVEHVLSQALSDARYVTSSSPSASNYIRLSKVCSSDSCSSYHC